MPGRNGALAAPPARAVLAPEGTAAIGIVFLALYLFVLFSRLPEITSLLVGTSFYQTTILGALALAAALVSGGVQRALTTRLGVLIIALHVWFFIAAPFSYWRGGTFHASLYLLRYLPIFILLGGMVVARGQLRTMMLTIAASVVVDLTWIVLSTKASSSRLELAYSRFSNANEIAIYLLIGLPFLLFIAMNRRFKAALRILAAATMIGSLFVVLRTGSRGGLLTMTLLFLMIWLGASVINKIKLLVAGIVLGTVLYASLSHTLRERFATIGNEQVSDTTGAVSSTDAREALLWQSIETTLAHPLVGVGLGVYAAAAADIAREHGEKAAWHVTHNAYTQISAESGIPALLFYLSILFICLRESYRIYKLGRLRPQFQELSSMAGCLFLSVMSFCLSGCFTSIALDFYFYTLVGFIAALSNIARREIEPATAAAQPVRLAGSPAGIPSPVGAAARSGGRMFPPPFSSKRDRRRRSNLTL
jgi:O-antigen ligase